jgi:hypothetical protein
MLIAAEGDIRRMGAESGAALFAHPDHASSIEAAIKEACALGRRALADRGRWGLRYYEETLSTSRRVIAIEKLLV